MKKNNMYIGTVQHIIASCCVLHNMWEMHMDSFDDDGMEVRVSELRQPGVLHTASNNNRPSDICDALVRYFAS